MAISRNAQCWLETKPEIMLYPFSSKAAVNHHGALKKICIVAIKHSERK